MFGKTQGIASHNIESDLQSRCAELSNVSKPQPRCESVFGYKRSSGPRLSVFLTNPGGKPRVVYQCENVGGGQVYQREASLKNG